MLETKFLYVLVMGFALLGPLALSFDKKVAFYKYFKPLFLATMPIALLFIFWDIAFTSIGVWGFNEKYLTGISLAGLPLGEYLFFFVIPYCCIFVYQVVKAYFSKDYFKPYSHSISNFLIGFSIALVVLYYDQLYTAINFSLLAISIFFFQRVVKAEWLGRFYFAFMIIIIPFLLVDGILTGAITNEEIVWYSKRYIIGLKIGTIPFEDLFYGLIQLLWVTGLFEIQLRHTALKKAASKIY